MFESEIISALDQVEQAAGSLWTLIDNDSRLFAEYKNAHDDVASRRSYASSLRVLHRLQEFQRTVCDGIERFEQKIGRFETQISRTAWKDGLNLLPDEILSEIFILAATELEEKVVLSLVCKQFRRVMMSMRNMWDEYWMECDQQPEQIISIAEGNNFVSLKARIYSPSLPDFVETWVADRGLDLEEYRMRYYKFSVGLILSFLPEELEIDSTWDWEAVEPILADGNMQNLRGLVMLGDDENSAARLLERWDMPHLQNLEVRCVPRSTLARNLVRCNLGGIGEDQFDSLKEFLAAAQSLQELKLFLSESSRPYEVCDLPSLRSLWVNFEPHPSLARHLARFQLSLYPERIISLSKLLNFLSSSEALQELYISTYHGFSEGRGTTDALPVVTLPNVVSCELPDYETCPTLVAKLRMPMVRKLKLGLYRFDTVSTMTTGNEFRTALQSMSSLEDLELMNGGLAVSGIDEIVRYAPAHLDSFSVMGCTLIDRAGWFAFPVPQRKLIRFMSCDGISRGLMLDFIDYLRAVGLDGVKLQLNACTGWRDGTFEVDNVMSASLDA